MTDTRLNDGISLREAIGQAKHSLDSIRLCLRELELNGPTCEFTRLKLGRTDCEIFTSRLINFLKAQIALETATLQGLEKQFASL